MDTPHLRFLRTIRRHELSCALAHFPTAREGAADTVVLEIGAGTGLQAKALAEKGYAVIAIDLPSSHYRNDRVHEIVEYDGRHVPLPDRSVDVIFSSNVLEHVADIDGFLEEQQRVIKDGGIAIHVLPSTACRIWGIPAHYAWLLRRIFALLFSRRKHPLSLSSPLASNAPRKPQSLRDWIITLFPMPHGERGNTLSEAYYFSQYWWSRKFREHAFSIIEIDNNGVFYTMANAMADSLNLTRRQQLARVLGSACHIYVLKSLRRPATL